MRSPERPTGRTKRRRALTLVGAILLGALWTLSIPAGPLQAQEEAAGAEEEDQADLAKAAQNPIANLISVPAQNNTSFGIGEFDRTSNVINIQPVIPIELSSSLNLITRTIFPIISAPDVTQPDGTTWGLGDLNPTAFFVPASTGAVMVGGGPSLLFPTATSDETGSGKWGAGPAIVLIATPGKALLGLLVNNIWSYAGPSDRADVNRMLLQYFINYNFPQGWYVTTGPIITSDWTKPSSAGWVVPFGGGGGKVFKIGSQPINGQIQAFYNAVTPKDEEGNRVGPEWSLRLQLQLLFPKG